MPLGWESKEREQEFLKMLQNQLERICCNNGSDWIRSTRKLTGL